MTRERIEKAKKLKLILTAGIGSDHIDLHAAADHGLTVAECVGAQHYCAACAVLPETCDTTLRC
jgi:formate dehydrogenase